MGPGRRSPDKRLPSSDAHPTGFFFESEAAINVDHERALAEPETPVTTVSLPRGTRTSIFFRFLRDARAPR